MTKKEKPKPLLPPEEAEQTVPPPPPKPSLLARIGQPFRQAASKVPLPTIFATPPITVDLVNEQLELGRINTLIKKLTIKAYIISTLGVLLAFGSPFFAPIYIFHAITPEGKVTDLVPLNIPNLTNPAVVSWAASSTTEILSFGFGDVDAKTIAQKKRFTTDGWREFVKAFLGAGIRETLKQSQEVMTTVPSDTPVIISQGVNEQHIYQWKLEVPIITTYAANNNVIRPEAALVEMTIVRVSHDISPAGIAIDTLKQRKR